MLFISIAQYNKLATTHLSQEISPQDVAGDEGMLNLLASLKYLRVNYVHFDSPELCVYEALRARLSSTPTI